MKLFIFDSTKSIGSKSFLVLLMIFGLTPLIGILLFKLGIEIRYHQINSLILFAFLFLSLFVVITNREIYRASSLLIGLLISSLLAFAFSSVVYFQQNKGSEVFGMILLNLGPQLFGILILGVSTEIKEKDLFKLLYYAGFFVALANILIFLMLLTGQYDLISSYMIHLGLESYIFDESSFFIRPSGYFFDIHSQYYLPLISIVILREYKFIQSKGLRNLSYLILIIALTVSGVKQGYLTILVLMAFWFTLSLNSYRSYFYLFLIAVLVIVGDSLVGNNIGKLWSRIWSHDINILREHLFDVPIELYKMYPETFLFGGQPHFANYIYSEVYLVQLIYYVGIVGLTLFFAIPMVYLFIKDKRVFVRSFVIIFLLSLLHYSVFKIGIKMIGTAFIFYLFYRNILYSSYKYDRLS